MLEIFKAGLNVFPESIPESGRPICVISGFRKEDGYSCNGYDVVTSEDGIIRTEADIDDIEFEYIDPSDSNFPFITKMYDPTDIGHTVGSIDYFIEQIDEAIKLASDDEVDALRGERYRIDRLRKSCDKIVVATDEDCAEVSKIIYGEDDDPLYSVEGTGGISSLILKNGDIWFYLSDELPEQCSDDIEEDEDDIESVLAEAHASANELGIKTLYYANAVNPDGTKKCAY